MKTSICVPHKLPIVSGKFCEECCKSLKAQSEQLNKFFNSPKVIRAINSVLEEPKKGVGVFIS